MTDEQKQLIKNNQLINNNYYNMTTNACFSFSLYGNTIYYYLVLLGNIKLLNENRKRFGIAFDIIINTEDKCKKLLIDISKQENISLDNVIFKCRYNPNIGSSGMMWRYWETTEDNYNFVYIHDSDTVIYAPNIFAFLDFITNSKYAFMICHVNNNSEQCIPGGHFAFNTKLFKTKNNFRKILELWDNEKDITYFSDEVLLRNIFKKYLQTDDMIVYSFLTNEIYKQNEKEKFKHVIQREELDEKMHIFKCIEYSCKDIWKLLKFYDENNNIYNINQIAYSTLKPSADLKDLNYKIDFIDMSNKLYPL